MSSDDRFSTVGQSFLLKRPGARGRDLRAWDAADEQLVEAAEASLIGTEGMRVLIVDDQFGALSAGLSRWRPTVVADSATLKTAIDVNQGLLEAWPPVYSWQDIDDLQFDLVILRLPRQLDYLGWLLRWVNGHVAPEGRILAGGMIKHLPDRCAELFGALVETEQVFPARKKARVILARSGQEGLSGWESEWRGYESPDGQFQVDALPAVFAREKLDIGTRQLLPWVYAAAAVLPSDARVLDLACGNGILGLSVFAHAPEKDLTVTFSDVSSQAAASARVNVERAFPGARAHFLHSDGIEDAGNSFDLILLNPPFHEGGVVGDHIALKLLQQSAQRLSSTGRLLMVGNRHLGYHKALKRYFRAVRQLAADPKFVVFEASHQEAGRS